MSSKMSSASATVADSNGPYFLGLDASTQALKASLLSSDLDVIAEAAVNFDVDLPGLKTRGGVQMGPKGSGEVFSPVESLSQAMDLLMERIKEKKWDVGRIRGVSAAGQQHASVYWSRSSSRILANIDSSKPLSPQLSEAFSRQTIPNWQDSSTTSECRRLESALGGPEALAKSTGSKAHERFTGAQIMRFLRLQPEAYAATDRISLVSSAITTLLCLDGEVKGIDESDACGMNMWRMDDEEREWNVDILNAIAGRDGAEELRRKLGNVETDGGRVVGKIGKWFVDRYGFNPECCIFPGTGDNPATFLSLTLRPAEGLISMGTSDVVLVSTDNYRPHPEYHAFFHPAQIAPTTKEEQDAGAATRENARLRYFNMLVYKNGSLAREHVRDLYFNKSWDEFNAAAESMRPKSGTELPTEMAFWWLLPDIIPDNANGVYRYSSTRSSNPESDAKSAQLIPEHANIASNALSILSSQLLNYRSRSSAILDAPTDGTLASLNRVYATGGASANPTILSLMADILSAPVVKNVDYDPETKELVDVHWNACSVGVAYKARWGWERHNAQDGRKWVEFDTFVQECRDRRATRRREGGGRIEGAGMEEEGVRNVAVPGPGAEAWEKSVEWWRLLEARAVKGK